MPSFSRSLEKALHQALSLASERHQEYATLEHLLLALLEDQDAAAVMRACNVDLDMLRRNLIEYIDTELANLATGADEVFSYGGVKPETIRDKVHGAIFTRVSPEQKNRVILALKSRGHVVGYMGDTVAAALDSTQDLPRLSCPTLAILIEQGRPGSVEAARERLRPILMTSFAFILGVLPLMLASGAGAASRHSIGTGVFAGMLFATTIGIFFIPLFFQVIRGLSEGGEAGRLPRVLALKPEDA